jgi:deazaflavin-dependent oxidoreductase (nitroreductase family)
MAETFLYLTTIGHKTGNPHEIEIWYVDYQRGFYLCAERREHTHWVQNIVANPQVQFSVGTRQNHEALVAHGEAIARILNPETESNLVHVVSKLFDSKYGWSNGLLVEVMPPDDEED